MDLYTLTDTFLANDVIDEFISVVWTERYSAKGDVRLIVPASDENVEKLAPGTFLALRGTNEVMLLETQSIEKGLLTVVGDSLLGFLNERMGWFRNPATTSTEDRIQDLSSTTMVPGQFISNTVNYAVIDPFAWPAPHTAAQLDWTNDKIPGLSLGAVDMSGTVKRLTIPVGPLYDGIAQLAQKEGVGISLYLESASPTVGYSLKFATYQGKKRTSDQSTYPLIRLSPRLESVSDLKELNSVSGYKNVAYVYYQGTVTTFLADPSQPAPTGFNRRVLVTDAQGEPVGRKVVVNRPPDQYGWVGGIAWGGANYTQTVVTAADLAAFLAQNARDALANHNYIRAVDGQTSPESDFQYGVDYGLGDIIELEGLTGAISNARITEYTRSQDKQGERQYPTISVVS